MSRLNDLIVDAHNGEGTDMNLNAGDRVKVTYSNGAYIIGSIVSGEIIEGQIDVEVEVDHAGYSIGDWAVVPVGDAPYTTITPSRR